MLVNVPRRVLTTKTLNLNKINNFISLKNSRFIQNASFKYLDDIPVKKGIYRPQNTNQVVELVNYARSKGAILRVMGAGHSVKEAIYAKNSNHNHINAILDGDLRKVHQIKINENGETASVDVGAGCHLGRDPSDDESTLKNSFNFQVDEKGYALPILGGMSHQTIAGFLSTSTAGGSLKHTIADVLEEIEVVNGKGEVVTLNKHTNENVFNASVVSMGLFGIITRARFKLPEKYLVTGTEINQVFKHSLLVSEDGHYAKLHDALTENEYFHMNWFPQKYVQRTTEWSGAKAGSGLDMKPYNHTLKVFKMDVKAYLALCFCNIFLNIFGGDKNFTQTIIGKVLNQFVPIGKPQEFTDLWYNALPNDDQADVDYLIKTSFTEIWFPLEQIDEVMTKLEKLFSDHPSYAGNFALELYGAKRSPYWLSPSYEHDVFRVDPYWWEHNFGDPREYFEKFWNILLPINGARLHWGKYLPEP
ncbi:20480_t:CDS:1, partial [Dentiscutata erythropus]